MRETQSGWAGQHVPFGIKLHATNVRLLAPATSELNIWEAREPGVLAVGPAGTTAYTRSPTCSCQASRAPTKAPPPARPPATS